MYQPDWFDPFVPFNENFQEGLPLPFDRVLQEYDELIHLYEESNQRPFLVPSHFHNLESSEFIQLLDDELDLDLSNYLRLMHTAIANDDYESVEKLIPYYGPDIPITVRMSIQPDILRLLRTRFIVTVQFDNQLDIKDVKSIMNTLDNLPETEGLLLVTNPELELFQKYAKLLGIHIIVKIRTNRINDKVIVISPSINELDIESIDHASRINLLESAINQGQMRLARRILSITDEDIDQVGVDGIIGYYNLLVLAKEYPDLIPNNPVSEDFLDMIEIDYDVQYCMRDELRDYWKLIENDFRRINNPVVMATLRGRVENCDQIINSMRQRLVQIGDKRSQEYVATIYNETKLCSNVIAASDSIEDENILYLISLLYDPTENSTTNNDNSVMSLLIDLHNAKLIEIRSYGSDHRYLEFLARRLASKMTKSSMNVAKRLSN